MMKVFANVIFYYFTACCTTTVKATSPYPAEVCKEHQLENKILLTGEANRKPVTTIVFIIIMHISPNKSKAGNTLRACSFRKKHIGHSAGFIIRVGGNAGI